MTFSVKQYMADKQLEPFPFEDVNGDTKFLPNLMAMTAGQANEFMSKMDTDPVAALAAIDPDMAETILAIPLPAVLPLADAYLEHCKLGEALASPASSKSTARPSKRTSPTTTKARTRKG